MEPESRQTGARADSAQLRADLDQAITFRQ